MDIPYNDDTRATSHELVGLFVWPSRQHGQEGDIFPLFEAYLVKVTAFEESKEELAMRVAKFRPSEIIILV